MELQVLNNLPEAEAVAALRPCLDVERWLNELVAARPFANEAELTAAAQASASPFEVAEITAALAHHPRIGEQAKGSSTEATLSRNEQASLNLDDDVTARLTDANRRYEERFNRVFLIRAAGRSTSEILAECERRLGNDDDTELREVAEQLRAIALLRLTNAVNN